jgi:membrane protease YdiL (CAAX protease family)
VAWGYSHPPELPPELEPPGSFHPPISSRPILSLRGRIAPRLYAVGLAVGLPAIVALLLIMIGTTAGIQFAPAPLPFWIQIEVVSLVAAAGLISWAVAQSRQRRADGWRDYNGPSPFLIAGAFLATATAGSLPIEVILKLANVDVQSPPATLAMLLAYVASYFGLVHFLAVRCGALTWHDIAQPRNLAPSSDDWGGAEPSPGWTRSWGIDVGAVRAHFSNRRAADVLVALAMVLPLMIVSNLISVGLLFALGLKTTDVTPDQVIARDGLSILITLVTVALIVPIGEEVFFRGFIANAWARSMSHNSAILRSALFFAFVHVMNTASTDAAVSWRVAIFNFGARVPVALALTWLYVRRRSILASGTLHAGYNGLITLISYL